MNPWFDPSNVTLSRYGTARLTEPAAHGRGVSVYDIAGVRDPEVEFQKYYNAVMAGDENPKTLELLNFWAERTGRQRFIKNATGRLVKEPPNMPPAWS